MREKALTKNVVRHYPWQESQWQEVLRWRQNGRLPQAVLLLGHHGFGQRHFAHVWAQALLCEQRGEYPCQVCKACQLFQTGNHPDFFYIAPEGETHKTIKIDQMRSLISAVHQSPYNSMQIVLIDPADSMTRASAHAFLKTLEEPPGSVLFILISAQLGRLLPTVVSRCHRLSFAAVDPPVMNVWVQAQLGIASDQARELLNLAYDVPLQALEFEKSNYRALRDRLLQQFVKLVQSNENPITAAASFINEPLPLLGQALFSLLLDLLRLSLKATQALTHGDQGLLLKSLVPYLSISTLLKLLQECQKHWIDIDNGVAVNVPLLLENIFLQIQGQASLDKIAVS